MENASKALIIAGAILLSILIISLGIMVYNNAKNTVGSANLNKQEIQTFNSQWEAYVGTNKTASEVRTMIQAVIASNAAETRTGEGRKVKTVNSENDTGAAEPTSVGTIASSSTYTISITYNENTGLVDIIHYFVPSTTPTTPTNP